MIEVSILLDVLSSVSYFAISVQLIWFFLNCKIVTSLSTEKHESKRNLAQRVTILYNLFCIVIVLNGFSHATRVCCNHSVESAFFTLMAERLHSLFVVACSFAAFLTAIAGWKAFPVIAKHIGEFEINDEGKVQRLENHWLQTIELFQKSVVVLKPTADGAIILRGNSYTNKYFGSEENDSYIGSSFFDWIHPEDLKVVREAYARLIAQSTSPRGGHTSHRSSGTGTAASPARECCCSCYSDDEVDNDDDSDDEDVCEQEEYYRNDISSSPSSASTPAAAAAAAGNVTRTSSFDAVVFEYRVKNRFEHHKGPYVWVESTARIVPCNEAPYEGISGGPVGGNDGNNNRSYTEKGARGEQKRKSGLQGHHHRRGRKNDSKNCRQVVMITRNIDDRKQTEQLKKQAKEKENEAKMNYISCIAHDLKTPLQSFCFSVELLKATSLSSEQKEIVDQALVSTDLMKLTISQTMDISKALAGAKLAPRRSTVLLSSVLQKVHVVIDGYSKQVPVSYHVADDVADAVITDEEWLWQMLLNLLTNACKYTDEGGIKVVVSLSAPLQGACANESFPSEGESAGPVLLFEVMDTGVGVSEAKISELFSPFSAAQAGQMQGTGLGLFGIRLRTDGLGGSCGARRNENAQCGSVFWFTIPYVPDTSAAMQFDSTGDLQGLYARALSQSLETRTATARSQLSSNSASIAFRAKLFAIAARCRTSSTITAVAASLSLSVSEVSDALHLDETLSSPFTSTAFSTSTTNVPSFPLSSSPSLSSGSTTVSSATPVDVMEIRVGEGMTAIVVDDVLMIRKCMQRVLRQAGFAKVICCENGKKGLEAMQQEEVDVVFSDVQMPLMSGPEMVRRFRDFEAGQLQTGQRTKRQLVVAVTANGNEFGGQEALLSATAFDSMLPKPVSIDHIHFFLQRELSASEREG